MRRVIAVPAALALLLLAGSLMASCMGQKSPTTPGGSVGNGELNGGLPSNGSQFAHMFTRTGTFNYECTIHPSCTGLHGVVVVVSSGTPITNRLLALSINGGSDGGPYGGASCSSLSNARDTVQVGDQVTWTNNSPLAHNVTSY